MREIGGRRERDAELGLATELRDPWSRASGRDRSRSGPPVALARYSSPKP